MTTTLTAMGGLLARTPDGWRWRDGRAETRVRDLTALEAFQFPVVTYPDAAQPGARARWISLPTQALDDEPDLLEMLRFAGPEARNSEHDAGRVEVPEALWRQWAEGRVIGVAWDAADEAALFAEAERLRAARA